MTATVLRASADFAFGAADRILAARKKPAGDAFSRDELATVLSTAFQSGVRWQRDQDVIGDLLVAAKEAQIALGNDFPSRATAMLDEAIARAEGRL